MHKEKDISEEPSETPETPVKRKRGRPRKSEITPKNRKIGRPIGDVGAMAEMKQRFLARRDTNAVIESIFKAAKDDEHKNQAAAWKLIVERILPMSSFDKDKLGGKPTVNITISGVNDIPLIEGETINHEPILNEAGTPD
tara:strand:+ start:440 stop:859 length:420 start_codon:yes stop_codon:yes gene_type:complete